MSGFNLAEKSKEEQDKVAVDLVASGVAYKERLAMPVVAGKILRVLVWLASLCGGLSVGANT